MGYRLVFTVQKETFTIEVDKKEVFYIDRKTKRVRVIPKDEQIQRLVLMSRNTIPKAVLDFFELNKSEQEEYDKCVTDEEVAEICIKDAKLKGGILQKKEVI